LSTDVEASAAVELNPDVALTGCAQPCTTRRTALAFGAAAGAAVLAGCSTYGESNGVAAPPAETTADAEPSASAGDGSGSGDKAATGGAKTTKPALAKTADIPVGGGKIFAAKAVVVTQPSKGTFKAFSTVCTHQGCSVNAIKDGTINCPCHGSKFAIGDGSVSDGPAPKSLPAKQISVEGDSIILG